MGFRLSMWIDVSRPEPLSDVLNRSIKFSIPF